MADVNVVTGSFGYLGRHITQKLIDSSQKVITLTGHTNRENSFGNKIKVRTLDFNDEASLIKNLEGAGREI